MVFFLSLEIHKVLTSISKERGCAALINWIRPCENHFFWSATCTLSGNGNVIYAKFKSFLSHVINKHDNLDDPLYDRCNHGEIKDRTWLEKGSVIVEKLTCMDMMKFLTPPPPHGSDKKMPFEMTK